jgi:2-keto-3-deoxy-L-rhamnonate aldolase RhmA
VNILGQPEGKPITTGRLQCLLDGEDPGNKIGPYIAAGAETRLLIVNIESVLAIEALDSILAVPGLDAVLIGPHDLSCSLGIPENYDHPDFLQACQTTFRKAGAGIHFWGEIEQQTRFLQLGANLLIHSADISLFQKHLKLELQAIRRMVSNSLQDAPAEALHTTNTI